MFEAALARDVPRLLEDLGLRIDGVHTEKSVVSARGGRANPRPDAVILTPGYRFLVEFKAAHHHAALSKAILQLLSYRLPRRARSTDVRLLVAPYMTSLGMRLCEEHDVSWLDLSGNAHIVAPGLRVIIQGLPNRYKHAGRPSNLFAPKSSRIAHALLLDPEKRWAQRQLARETGLGEGFVSRIVKRMILDGYATREKGLVRVADPRLLLDAWRDVYSFSEHEILSGHVSARSGEQLLQRIAEACRRHRLTYAATGLSAAWLYSRFAGFRLVTIYIDKPPPAALLREIGFREQSGGENLWLVSPGDEGVFMGTQPRDGIVCASAVQVYLDLKTQPERAREAADELREKHLKWSANG